MSMQERIELMHQVTEKFRCNVYQEFTLQLYPVLGRDVTALTIGMNTTAGAGSEIFKMCDAIVKRSITNTYNEEKQQLEVAFFNKDGHPANYNTSYPKYDENGFLGTKLAADHIYEFFMTGRIHYRKE